MDKNFAIEKFNRLKDGYANDTKFHQMLNTTDKSFIVANLSRGIIEEHWLDEKITSLMQNDFPEFSFCLISSKRDDIRFFTLYVKNDEERCIIGGTVEDINPRFLHVSATSFRTGLKETIKSMETSFIKHLLSSPFLKLYHEAGILKVKC